jgi:hypothetical protein
MASCKQKKEKREMNYIRKVRDQSIKAGHLQAVASHAEGHDDAREALLVEVDHNDVEAGRNVSDDVGGWHHNVVKLQKSSVTEIKQRYTVNRSIKLYQHKHSNNTNRNNTNA